MRGLAGDRRRERPRRRGTSCMHNKLIVGRPCLPACLPARLLAHRFAPFREGNMVAVCDWKRSEWRKRGCHGVTEQLSSAANAARLRCHTFTQWMARGAWPIRECIRAVEQIGMGTKKRNKPRARKRVHALDGGCLSSSERIWMSPSPSPSPSLLAEAEAEAGGEWRSWWAFWREILGF